MFIILCKIYVSDMTIPASSLRVSGSLCRVGSEVKDEGIASFSVTGRGESQLF
jgi:hypothetical protein